MRFRSIVRTLHRWLGLTSGLLVFVVALSGSLYVFEREFRDWLDRYRHVDPGSGPLLPPSELRTIAERQLPGESAARMYYQGPRRAAFAQFGNIKTQNYKLVFLNPYDGCVLKVKDMNYDFFHVVFSLHYRLLLRPDLGTTIVDTATLVFVVVLISGLVNWWPRTRAAIGQRLRIKWQTVWRRRNYDLHNVLGFYVLPVSLVVALTGLVWGFAWVNHAVRWFASGSWTGPLASESAAYDMPTPTGSPIQNLDAAWKRIAEDHHDAEELIVFFPSPSQATIRFVVNPQRYTYYKTDHFDFDPITLAATSGKDSWGRYENATLAGIVRRANYDIHIGAILGPPGKMIAFLAGLVTASLPVTGFLIWWGKRRRTKACPPG
jgi:uncharacterized iron-regulated membrane protein